MLARMHAHYGEMEQAADCIATGLRVGRHVTQAPSTIAQCVAIAMYQILEQAGEDMLRERDVPPVAARRLADQLRDNGLVEGMRGGLIGERASALTQYQHCVRSPWYGWQFAMAMARLTDTPPWFCVVVGWNPAYWRRQEWVALRHTDRLLLAVNSPTGTVALARSAAVVGTLPPGQAVPRSWDIADIVGLAGFAVGHSLKQRVRLSLLEAALGIQAYRSTHGQYPHGLRAVGWELPTDPCSGQDFAYRRKGNGFILYSVGGNGRDDGGTPPSAFGKWLDDGDIVWPDPFRHRYPYLRGPA
jgi:hypothetical protein